MKLTQIALASAFLVCAAAHAQTAATETARDTDQQQRIDNGVQSGQLTTHEAANLEHHEQRIDHAESRDARDGTLSAAEKAQIQREQNRVSSDIHAQSHDAQTGNPASASSQRMQAGVRRNVNQESRINQGIRSGALTNQEVGNLEHGQARVAGEEARAGANGRIGARGQAHIQRADDRQSDHVRNKKRNGQERAGG